jgi:hypothetical protein
MRALICHQAQPQWKTLCMIKPQRVFLMQRLSSKGMAVQGGDLPVLQQCIWSFVLDWLPCCCTLGCGKQHSRAVRRSCGSSWV